MNARKPSDTDATRADVDDVGNQLREIANEVKAVRSDNEKLGQWIAAKFGEVQSLITKMEINIYEELSSYFGRLENIAAGNNQNINHTAGVHNPYRKL